MFFQRYDPRNVAYRKKGIFRAAYAFRKAGEADTVAQVFRVSAYTRDYAFILYEEQLHHAFAYLFVLPAPTRL